MKGQVNLRFHSPNWSQPQQVCQGSALASSVASAYFCYFDGGREGVSVEADGEIKICHRRIDYWRLRCLHGLVGGLVDLGRTMPEANTNDGSNWMARPVWWAAHAREGISAVEEWRSQEVP